ncbi:MAG: LuxR C-terminal-related transcriptional regulator [Nanoarchaeota archaeon]|nr:LuxR C-terminal-related transcriptional regulator [Nanoarchaeota archaeon]
MKRNNNKIYFTHRQLELFKLWNEGLTQKQIAKELKVSFSYVNKTLGDILKKMGVDKPSNKKEYFPEVEVRVKLIDKLKDTLKFVQSEVYVKEFIKKNKLSPSKIKKLKGNPEQKGVITNKCMPTPQQLNIVLPQRRVNFIERIRKQQGGSVKGEMGTNTK